jgi:hypothetical protein
MLFEHTVDSRLSGLAEKYIFPDNPQKMKGKTHKCNKYVNLFTDTDYLNF